MGAALMELSIPRMLSRNFGGSPRLLAKKKASSREEDAADGAPIVFPSIKELEQSMDRKFSRLAIEFAEMRGGRVTPDMFNHVSIEAHGTRIALQEIGQATLKTASKINISVYDPELVQAIVRGIRESGHGLSPISEGNNIIINVPKPSKEAREAMVKMAGRVAERVKQEIRGVRKDGLDAIKKLKSRISEDDTKKLSKEVDALTEKKVDAVARVLKDKEKELLGE